MVKASGLSALDRSLGALFGLLRGIIIVSVVVLLCGLTAIPQQAFWRDATLSPYAVALVQSIKPLLPDDFARRVQF
jgi:membrane protein required for colicin V production